MQTPVRRLSTRAQQVHAVGAQNVRRDGEDAVGPAERQRQSARRLRRVRRGRGPRGDTRPVLPGLSAPRRRRVQARSAPAAQAPALALRLSQQHDRPGTPSASLRHRQLGRVRAGGLLGRRRRGQSAPPAGPPPGAHRLEDPGQGRAGDVPDAQGRAPAHRDDSRRPTVPRGHPHLRLRRPRNALKLFSLERPQGDIATLHGIRALNAFMLILAHKSLALFFNPYTNRTDMTEYVGKPWTVIGRAASLYTDPFIMLSGLLTAYSFLGRLSRTGKLDVRSEYVSRLFRIVPTLGALVLFCTFVMPFIGSGPQWSLVVTQHADICKKTWWRNFLFIHNYFGFENMCLTHTHHVGIDTQLFFLSPLMVLAVYKRPRIGFAALAALATISTALRFFVTYHYRLNNYVFFGTSIRQLFDTANLSYILPSHRLTVYILGVFVGYVLRNWPKNRRINDTIASLGWYLCIAMFLGAFFGPAGMGSIDYVYDPVHAATYNAFAPIGWCALFVWVTFVTHTGNSSDGWLSRAFSWRGFLVTTRLSYAVYLTQFPVFFYNVGQTRSAEYIGFIRMLLNVKELIWILLTSAILTLLFEMPFQNLRNYYVKGSKERPAGASSVTTEKAQKEIKAQ
uniref:Acyltransferase 3 domain-containing protein n=1 Tax=Trichogramma kaykai TaxID=54128 RepID=A0ABD2XP29_9HYME